MKTITKCLLPCTMLAALSMTVIVGDASAEPCRENNSFGQPESRDGSGRITVEAARIHVMSCSGTEVFIYQYVNRPGFRVIRPPAWGSRIGGRDFGSYDDALAAANAATGSSSGGSSSADSAIAPTDDPATVREAIRQYAANTAQVQEGKLQAILNYLNANGIQPKTSGDLELASLVTLGHTGRPVVVVSASSNLRFVAPENEDVWVFGMLGGNFMYSTQECLTEACRPFSVTGHSFKLNTTIGKLTSGRLEAETSITLLQPNALLKVKPMTAFPSPPNTYFVYQSQFRQNPGAIQGFLDLFIDLGRDLSPR